MQKKTKNKSGLNILLGKEDTKEKSKCIWGPREVTRPFGPLPVLSQASSQRIMGRLDRIFREGESPQVPGPPPQHTHLAQLVSKPRPIPSCQFIHPLMSCWGCPLGHLCLGTDDQIHAAWLPTLSSEGHLISLRWLMERTFSWVYFAFWQTRRKPSLGLFLSPNFYSFA